MCDRCGDPPSSRLKVERQQCGHNLCQHCQGPKCPACHRPWAPRLPKLIFGCSFHGLYTSGPIWEVRQCRLLMWHRGAHNV